MSRELYCKPNGIGFISYANTISNILADALVVCAPPVLGSTIPKLLKQKADLMLRRTPTISLKPLRKQKIAIVHRYHVDIFEEAAPLQNRLYHSFHLHRIVDSRTRIYKQGRFLSFNNERLLLKKTVWNISVKKRDMIWNKNIILNVPD